MEINGKEEDSPSPTAAGEGDGSVPAPDAEQNGMASDLKNGSEDAAESNTKTGAQEPPPPVEKISMPEEFALNEVLQQLTSGTEMVKVKSRNKRFVRQYHISHDLHYMSWWPSRKSASHSRSECPSRAPCTVYT